PISIRSSARHCYGNSCGGRKVSATPGRDSDRAGTLPSGLNGAAPRAARRIKEKESGAGIFRKRQSGSITQMSAPSGARFERIDNRHRQLRTENENSIGPSEENNDPELSAYAPKRRGRMYPVPRAEERDASDADMPRFVLGGAGLGESQPGANSEGHL